MAYNFFNFLYFSFATSFGYFALKDQNWFPKELGGNGKLINIIQDFPYFRHPNFLEEYLLITMGFHVGSLITHFQNKKQNDFNEMMLHHIVTIYLYGGAYLLNVWEVGGTIALLHDIADITTNLVKLLSDTNYHNWTVIFFVIHMFIWFYTRCCLLPYYIYMIWDYEIPMQQFSFLRNFFCFLLLIMAILHIYWFIMFI